VSKLGIFLTAIIILIILIVLFGRGDENQTFCLSNPGNCYPNEKGECTDVYSNNGKPANLNELNNLCTCDISLKKCVKTENFG